MSLLIPGLLPQHLLPTHFSSLRICYTENEDANNIILPGTIHQSGPTFFLDKKRKHLFSYIYVYLSSSYHLGSFLFLSTCSWFVLEQIKAESMCVTDEDSVASHGCWSGPDRNILTNIGWIAMKCCTNIHGAQIKNPNDICHSSFGLILLRMNYDHDGDPLIFHSTPPSGQNFTLSL